MGSAPLTLPGFSHISQPDDIQYSDHSRFLPSVYACRWLQDRDRYDFDVLHLCNLNPKQTLDELKSAKPAAYAAGMHGYAAVSGGCEC